MPIGCAQMQGTGKLESVEVDDWTPQTLPTWRHSNWVGVWDPWPVIFKLNPFVWYKVLASLAGYLIMKPMGLQAPHFLSCPAGVCGCGVHCFLCKCLGKYTSSQKHLHC